MGKLTLVSASVAREALRSVTRVLPAETVALYQARGRFLAQDLFATEAIPQAPRAAMDGFAVQAADLRGATQNKPVDLHVVGEVFAGVLFGGSLQGGQAVRIPTGGCLPAGADAVVPVELAAMTPDDHVRFIAPSEAAQHVVPIGQDLRTGQLLLRQGMRLQPAHLAVLGATGAINAVVAKRPRVTVFSSGAEVCAPGVQPNPAQVRDINQILLGSLAAASGAEVTYGGIIADDETLLRQALDDALAASDVIILSAGTSVGTRDFAARSVAALAGARMLFHGVNMRPGKPTLVAQIQRSQTAFVCGLPGFPTSAAVAFAVFVAPLLKQLQGALNANAWRLDATGLLAAPYHSVVGREDYVRVKLDPAGPAARVATVISEGPALITGLLHAEGFVLVPEQTETLPAGAPVEILTLDL